MHQQLINPATGEFTLDNQFVISDNTTIEDLTAHFGEKLSADRNGNLERSSYNVRYLQIGELYFIFTFNFFYKLLISVTFVVRARPYDGADSWDNFNIEEEIKEGEFMKQWMVQQLKSNLKKYDWGQAYTTYDFHNFSTSCNIQYRNVNTGEKLK